MASKGIRAVLATEKSYRPQPTLSLGAKDLPEIKDWKVGGKYTITLEVEETEARKGDSYYEDEGSKELRATFKVLKAHVTDEEDED